MKLRDLVIRLARDAVEGAERRREGYNPERQGRVTIGKSG